MPKFLVTVVVDTYIEYDISMNLLKSQNHHRTYVFGMHQLEFAQIRNNAKFYY